MQSELTHPGVIEHWVKLAEDQQEQEQQRWLDRREGHRCAFFRPATIIRETESAHRFSAFTRDISMSGVGLLHDFPLDHETIDVLLESDTQPLHVQIQWCRSCGAGWFVSGGRFV